MNYLVVGSFAGNNWGDTLVLKSVIDEIKQIDIACHFYIPSSNPNFILNELGYSNITPLNINMRKIITYRFFGVTIIRILHNIDIIITTAGIYFLRKYFNPRHNFISSLFPLFILSRYLYKIKIVGMHIGITKPNNRIEKFVLNRFLKLHDVIITRDQDSYQYILNNSLNIKNIIQSIDIVHYNMKIDDYYFSGNKEKIGINLTYQYKIQSDTDIGINSFISLFKKIIDYLVKNYKKEIVFFSTSPHDTLFMQKINERKITIYELYDMRYEESIEMYQSTYMFIGMRLHSLIISTNLGIPSFGIEYNPKVKSYFKDIESPDLCYSMNELNKNYGFLNRSEEELYKIQMLSQT